MAVDIIKTKINRNAFSVYGSANNYKSNKILTEVINMKKTISLILSLVTILSVFTLFASAKNDEAKEYAYKVLKDKTVEITAYNGSGEDVVVPATLDGKKVSGIGELSFIRKSTIKKLTISEGIKKISCDAFMGCESMKTVIIPNSVTTIEYGAFQGCSSLEEVKLPSGLKELEEAVFWYCEKLKEIAIPDSVTKIGDSAFFHCASLSKITFPKGLESIGSGAFGECAALESIYLPNSLKTVGYTAFSNCTSLKKIRIANYLKELGMRAFENTAFWNNKGNWDNGVLYLGKYLVGAEKTLSGEVKVKEGTRIIDNSAFSECKKLKSLYIPKSVKAFSREYTMSLYGCSNLKSIIVDKDNKYYTSVSGVLYNKKQTVLYRYPSARKGKAYNIPKSVLKIENGAFEGSRYLTTVNFDKNSKAVIGYLSFYNCKAMKTLTLPQNVKVDEECGYGIYYKGVDPDFGIVPGWVKGAVLKGYAGSDAEYYASCAAVKFVSLCKDGKEHKLVKMNGKEPTYFEDGYTPHERCTVCGERIGCYKIERKYIDSTKISVSSGKGYIKVSYKAVKNANGFQVMYVDKNGKQVRKIFMTNKSTTVKITGVPKGEYKVYARAMIKNGNQRSYSRFWSYDAGARTVTVK